MNPPPPAYAVKVAPAQPLSTTRFALGWVLVWTLWSPRTFIRYVEGLLKPNQSKTSPPVQVEQEQRTLVHLAVGAGVLVLLGLFAINFLHAAALTAVDWEEKAVHVAGYFGTLLVFEGGMIGWYLWARPKRDNLGFFLAVALPGGLAFALLWMIAWWFKYIDHFLAADYFVRAAIFMLWGYGLGYAVNYAMAMTRMEVVNVDAFAGWYALVCLAILTVSLVVSGAILQPTLQFEAYEPALWAIFWCCFGLLTGLLRPLEYLLLLRLTPPGPDQEGRERVWVPPGATLLPAYRMQRALDRWLNTDRDEGVYVASELSHASYQQQPLIVPLQGQLALCDTDEMLAVGFSVCDGGARCAAKVIQPPLAPSRPQTRAERAKGQDRLTREYEATLASIVKLPATVPAFKLDNDANTVNAMLWYYSQGLLPDAAKVWRQAGGKNGAIAKSSPRVAELGALIETFEILLNLDSASATPKVALPEPPAHQFRTKVWPIIDQLAGAAGWAWRARQCKGNTRDTCLNEFGAELKRIENGARSGSLAEQNIIRSITRNWQVQIQRLLADGKRQPDFKKAEIRPWETMHGELGDLDPWGQFRIKLHQYWQPGYTIVTLVDGLPKSKFSRATAVAAGGPPAAVWAPCDLKNLPSNPFTPVLLAAVCRAVAVALQLSESLPVGLAGLKPAALRDEIDRLCRQAPATRVVVYIDNAQRLVNGELPFQDSQPAIQALAHLERRIHNLALTLAFGSEKEMADQLCGKLKTAGLDVKAVYMSSLTWFGVQQWLNVQFKAAGLHCDDSAVLAAYRLTGGHPLLLEHLGHSIADNYNDPTLTAPPCPLIDSAAVEHAAQSSGYTQPVDKFSEAVLHKYGADEQHRLLLYELADLAVKNSLATAAEIKHNAANLKFAVTEMQDILDKWESVGLVEQPAGQTGYQLLGLSLAQKIVQTSKP